MTREHIEDRIAEIVALVQQRKDETAHSYEDDLRDAFVQALADNTLDGDPRELAALVLTTNDLDFYRWFG